MTYKGNDSVILESTLLSMLLVELHENSFLGSESYSQMSFSTYKEIGPCIKDALSQVTLYNGAFIQTQLYMLLVVPFEALKESEDKSLFETKIKDTINSYVRKIAIDTKSTYESDKKEVNYYRHIRNAVSHSKVVYNHENPNSNRIISVSFHDNKKKQKKCSFTIDLNDIIGLIIELQIANVVFYQNKEKNQA